MAVRDHVERKIKSRELQKITKPLQQKTYFKAKIGNPPKALPGLPAC